MDRPPHDGFRLIGPDRKPVVATDGVFVVQDVITYTVESDGPQVPELLPHLKRLDTRDGRVGLLCFENFVGRAEVGTLRFDVRHSKLDATGFEHMLDTVSSRMAELVFGYQSPTGFGVAQESPATSASVPFHALSYLRHALLRLQGGEGLTGQFLQIARHPHRKVEVEPTWLPVSHAAALSPSGLAAIASHPERLQPIHAHHPLAQTGLGRAIHRAGRAWRFPAEVLSTQRTETFDTHENRLVKLFLREALAVVQRFEGERLKNPQLKDDLATMRGQLEWMAGHDFLSEVGELTVFPSDSTVLQRRAGYKELFQHWLALRAGTALQDDALWRRLLDAKDCATLYELWSFFAVKDLLDGLLGEATRVDVAVDDFSANVPWGAKATYGNGVTLTFNRSYPGASAGGSKEKGGTSYSVRFRPDLTVHAPRKNGSVDALVLDAKFKFDGARLKELEDKEADVGDDEAATAEVAPLRKAVVGDLHKMHAYRDALRDVKGAFVLFPGNHPRAYLEKAGSPVWEGIGAFPLVPSRGEAPQVLLAVLAAFVGKPR